MLKIVYREVQFILVSVKDSVPEMSLDLSYMLQTSVYSELARVKTRDQSTKEPS